MDPVSQAVLGVMGRGVIPPRFESKKLSHFKKCLLGILGGIFPDIDYIIRIPSDPLFTIEYHRQFTHSLFFIPFGAMILALLVKVFKINIKDSYPYLFLGVATHGLLDAFTNYGTQLWWPFSDKREAWNCVAVVDPVITLPLIILIYFYFKKENRKYILASWILITAYFSLNFIQKNRAKNVLINNNIVINDRVMIKPTIGNNFIWRVIKDDGHNISFYAVRLGFFGDNIFYTGDVKAKVHPEEMENYLINNPIQLNDYKRFKYFTDDYLFWLSEDEIADARYSLLPFSSDPIWHLKFRPFVNEHVQYITKRKPSEEDKLTLKSIWLGRSLD